MLPRVVRLSLLQLAILVFSVAIAIPCAAQQASGAAARALTAADYARAEKFMGYNTTPLVFHSGVRPAWLPDERFWYRNLSPEGSEFVFIDPAEGTRAPAFDHAKLAAALSAASGATYDAQRLPFTDFDFSADLQIISFNVRNRRWKCDLTANVCKDEGAAPAPAGPGASLL